ncbi:MAG: DUF1549 and DUF1553 domain-containing protein [Gemmataceae bacterium]|nr:DUF1549 and DUF1553 domain-containing protein [Gemmataceae bacterium]MDW8242630.1 DUF1549 and DUF1553 domain-containing protein [Thermogemmata sp.]
MSRAVGTVMLALIGGLLALEVGWGQESYREPPLTPQDRTHWAFVPPRRAAVPAVPSGWAARNAIDAFIYARLHQAGLQPSPEADKRTLLRRLYFDLLGLPPTPEEADAFLNDPAADAYEKLVDRLLASPHFGERWAQHWLDVVRFAETNGYELDGDRPHAWRYRDYVIRSFNADKPYDRFLTEQLAGDELAAGKDPRQTAELWIATGMHRCGPVHIVSGNLDQEMLRQERLTEMVKGVGTAILALTVDCARCHDHKFDPFSMGDYYRLQAFFAAARHADIDIASPEEKEAYKKQAAPLQAEIAALRKQVADIDAPYRAALSRAKREKLEPHYRQALDTPADKRTPQQKKLAEEAAVLIKVSWEEVVAALSPADRERRSALKQRWHELEARLPPPPAQAWAIRNEEPIPTFILKRGEPHRKLVSVVPAFPRVLTATAVEPKSRLDLARWLTRPDHPLTARVIVNRLWQHYFGRGLVPTTDDFGLRGQPPSHPELLDYLAVELVEHGWSLKHIHRLIVTSATYRQSALTTHGRHTDPDNRLLWRMNRQRLDAEALRDAVLTAAGTLNRALGGPSVRVPLEPEVYALIFTEGEPDGLWPVTPDPRQHTRRSIYLYRKRNVRLPLLEVFDQPDTLNPCAARPVSTFAPQALILMNSPFIREQGMALAALLFQHCPTDEHQRLQLLFRRCYSRPPTASEQHMALEFLHAQQETLRDRLRARQPIGIDPQQFPPGTDLAQARAWADLAVVLFNTHEFVYKP